MFIIINSFDSFDSTIFFLIAAECMDTDKYYAARGFIVAENVSISDKPNIMGLNKKFKFRSNAMERILAQEYDNPDWEITTMNEIIPWVPTFSYLVPKNRKRKR